MYDFQYSFESLILSRCIQNFSTPSTPLPFLTTCHKFRLLFIILIIFILVTKVIELWFCFLLVLTNRDC
jgi:hypothetical protein